MGSDARVDLEHPYLQPGARTDCDVTVVNPFGSTGPQLARAARTTGIRAQIAEQAKFTKYNQAGLSEMPDVRLYPLAMEYGGHMGVYCRQYLSLLKQHAVRTNWGPAWWFHMTQVPKVNVALMEGHRLQLARLRNLNVRFLSTRRGLGAG